MVVTEGSHSQIYSVLKISFETSQKVRPAFRGPFKPFNRGLTIASNTSFEAIVSEFQL